MPRQSSQHIDALLASLYAWKQHNRAERMTVVLDEIEDLCLEKDGSVSTILRKGGKHRLSMLLATQEFSVEKDRLGKLIGNCGIGIVFRPKDANIDGIAKHIGVDRQQLSALEMGEFVACGGFYSRSKARNARETLWGRAFTAADLLAPDEPVEVEVIPADDPEQTAEPQSDLIEPEPWVQTGFPLMLAKSEPESSSPERTVSEPFGPTPPVSESDAPEEDTQEIIELELQVQFQSIMRSFSPDYPNWTAYLSDFFEHIMKKHRFTSASDRGRLSNRLECFLYISPECSDYRERLEGLFKEIWPNA